MWKMSTIHYYCVKSMFQFRTKRTSLHSCHMPYDDPCQGHVVLDIKAVLLIKGEAAWCKKQHGTMAVAADPRTLLLHEGQKLYLRAALIIVATCRVAKAWLLLSKYAEAQKHLRIKQERSKFPWFYTFYIPYSFELVVFLIPHRKLRIFTSLHRVQYKHIVALGCVWLSSA